MMRKISLRTVVIGGVAIGLLVPMSLGTFHTMRSERARLYQDADAAHKRALNVLSLGVSKALWDLSPEAAVPLVDSILDDQRIVSVQILDGQGGVFHEKNVDERKHGTTTSLEKPVLNGTEKIGLVKIGFSLASAEQQISEKMREAVGLALAQAIACIAILVLLINRRLLVPIGKLKNQAGLIARKSLDTPFKWTNRDEIGDLGTSLETTRVALKDLFAELEQKNAHLAALNGNLEAMVAERTATIKMILDHVKSGFLLVDKSLTVQGGYTRSCEVLLNGQDLAGRPLTEVLHLEPSRAGFFTICLEQVFDDFLPEDVSINQIPRRYKIGDRSISLEGSTVRGANGEIEKILFTIGDITALEQVEAENRANRAIVRIMQNISAFHDFIQESNSRLVQAVAALGQGDEPIVRRELHTLKGNSAAFGMDHLSELIHQIEDQSLISQENLAKIEDGFSGFLENNFELFRIRFGEEAARWSMVYDNELIALHDSLNQAHQPDEIRNRVKDWIAQVKKVPVVDVLGPIDGYVQKIAGERHRQVDFQIVGGDLKIERHAYNDVLQNLIHLIRNAVDHGIETAEERGDKNPVGTIQLAFSEDDKKLTITLRDDGRGIDAKRVKGKAVAMGVLSAESAARLTDGEAYRLIFSDGLSTAESVSDISGRGVGMKAVLDAIQNCRGDIQISSTLGKGTQFTIVLPKATGKMEMPVAA